MNPIFIRILGFCLVPASIFILIKAIKSMRKTFYGKIIVEMPYKNKSSRFRIEKKGTFAIWQKGEVFKRTPVSKFKPIIINELTRKEIYLLPSFLRPHVNDFSTGRNVLYTFSADAGDYQIDLVDGSCVTKAGTALVNVLPLPLVKNINTDKYYIQIRESQPFYYPFISIHLILLSICGIVGGLILGIGANQFF